MALANQPEHSDPVYGLGKPIREPAPVADTAPKATDSRGTILRGADGKLQTNLPAQEIDFSDFYRILEQRNDPDFPVAFWGSW